MKRVLSTKTNLVNFTLDSGAFSAWRLGQTLNLDSYIEFVKNHEDLITDYVCLDVIPGNMGQMDRTQASIELSASKSYENQQKMKAAGLSPIPVFHQGERFEWLEKYIDDEEPYIGISPYLKSSAVQMIAWLDNCFSILTNSDGKPIVRTHGFGVTHPRMLLRYPWHSVDSSTWIMASAYGMIVCPSMGKDGEPDFRGEAQQTYIGTGESPVYSRQRVDRVPVELKWVSDFADYCGLSLAELRNSRYNRMRAIVKYYMFLEQFRGEVLFNARRRLFTHRPHIGELPAANVRFRVILVTNIHKHFDNRMLNGYKYPYRLLSYFHLRQHDDPRAMLEHWVRHGVSGEYKGLIQPPPRVEWELASYRDHRAIELVNRLLEGTRSDAENDSIGQFE